MKDMTRDYIAIGPNCYGVGSTKEAARKAMARAWPRFIPQNGAYAVYSCPPGSRVCEDTGGIIYPKDADKPPFIASQGNRAIAANQFAG